MVEMSSSMKNRKYYNVEAAEELVKTYKSITLEKVTEAFMQEDSVSPFITPSNIGRHIAQELTGFSNARTCTLCQSASKLFLRLNVFHVNICEHCVHGAERDGLRSSRQCAGKTYDKIYYATTPEDLLVAFRKRANYLEELLKTFQ